MTTSHRVDQVANTAQEMIEAQRGFYEAWTASFIDSQKRAVRFVQSAADSASPQHESAARLNEVFTDSPKVWQSWLKTGTDFVREQADENQRLSEAFAESVRAQQESLAKLGEEWSSLYKDFLSSVYSSGEEGFKNTAETNRQGIEAVQNVVGRVVTDSGNASVGSANGSSASASSANGSSANGLPIEGYDQLPVNDITGKLGGLSEADLRKLLEHEKANKDRGSLVVQIERKISA